MPESVESRPVWFERRACRYAKITSIGAGSFGDVTMAIDRITNQKVAIKKQDIAHEACGREFALLSALGGHPCPYVATMLDYFTETVSDRANQQVARSTSAPAARPRSILFTVHPLADTTLWHVFKACPEGVSEDRSVRYLYGVSMGLAHLHRLSIVHGDASLKNMLVVGDDCVVADFGAAVSAMTFCMGADTEITTQYVRCPERIFGAAEVRKPTDIWAFGVQVWCLHSGSCSWITHDSDEQFRLSLQIRHLARILGPIPENCSLQSLPKFPTLSEHARTQTDGADSKLEKWPNWPAQMQSLCLSALCWEPAVRRPFAEILCMPVFAAHGRSLSERPAKISRSSVEQASQTASEPAGDTTTAPQRAPSPASATGMVPQLPQGSAVPALTTSRPDAKHCCECRGACGHRDHKRRQNLKLRGDLSIQICTTVLSGRPGRYCDRCSCELAGCDNLRLTGKQGRYRWCQKHAHQMKCQRGEYSIPSGKYRFEATWPPDVKLLARIAHILPMVEPTDLTVLRDWVKELGALTPGEPLDAVKFAAIFVAHLIKWPPVVGHFQTCFRQVETATAEDFVALYRSCIRWASDQRGDAWKRMFLRMNGTQNRMDASSGLVVHGSRLGLLSGKLPAKSKSTSAKGGGDAIHLGRAGSLFLELESSDGAAEVFSNLLKVARESGLRAPSNPSEVPKFADAMLTLIRQIRDYKSELGAWLQGGRDEKQSYQAKHLLRVFLLAIDNSMPAAFDDLPFSELSKWCPDEKNMHSSWAMFPQDGFGSALGCRL